MEATLKQTAYLSVPNWDELQHYKDRSPPWIKLHNDLLESYEFECLPDASKAHLLCIFLLASRTNNKINPDPKWIARKICANSTVDVAVLVDSGFLVINQPLPSVEQDASTVIAECLPRGRVEESRVEGEQSRAEGSSESRFNAFWNLYPKKKSKGAAEKAWKKISAANQQATIDKLPEAIKSEEWTKDGGKFIPYPASWLSAKGWEDEFSAGVADKYANLFFDDKPKGAVIDGEIVPPFGGLPNG